MRAAWIVSRLKDGRMKASDLLVRCLEEEDVEYIFGVPGEENADVMMSLEESNANVKFGNPETHCQPPFRRRCSAVTLTVPCNCIDNLTRPRS